MFLELEEDKNGKNGRERKKWKRRKMIGAGYMGWDANGVGRIEPEIHRRLPFRPYIRVRSVLSEHLIFNGFGPDFSRTFTRFFRIITGFH